MKSYQTDDQALTEEIVVDPFGNLAYTTPPEIKHLRADRRDELTGAC
jgi:hypothetical protein